MGTQTETVTVELHPRQAEFCDSKATLRGFVAGRGAGKTFTGAHDLWTRAEAGRLYCILAPTYKDLLDVSWRELVRQTKLARIWNKKTFNKNEMRATLWTGAEIIGRSADDPDSLRGPNLSGLWIDEASKMKEEVYHVAIGALREQGRMGWLSATFTPKGRQHWTYKVFGAGGDGAQLFHARTDDNPFVDPAFVEMLRSQYGPLRARQEIEGQFVDIEGSEWPGSFFGPSIWFDEWPSDWLVKVSALDPSKGKDAKHGDYSAFVNLMVCLDGHCYIEADLDRRPVNQIVDTACEIQRVWQPDAFGVEVNQFQEMLASQIRDRSIELGQPLNVFPLDNRVNKEVRIRRLTADLADGHLHFKANSKGTELLVDQLMGFPEEDHDDGPDALEMATRVAVAMLPTARGERIVGRIY